MELSIIIPVYKVEKYIGDTLQSIVSQKNDSINFDVIIIDDGSPDNSMQIVESFKDKLPQMKILHQENMGLSGARNAGLKNATGKYVWFVDSDDTIANGILKKIGNILPEENSDVLGFNVNVYLDKSFEHIERPFNKRKYFKFKSLRHTGSGAGECLGTGMAQRFLFRRDFLYTNNLYFLEGVIFEDVEFLVRVRCLAKSIAVFDATNYCYYRRSSGSIMSTLDMRSIYSRMKIRDNWDRFGHLDQLESSQKRLVYSHCFGITCNILNQQNVVKTREYSEFYRLNRWDNTIIGIKYFMFSFGFHSIKDYLKLFFLVVNPKLNSKLK